MLLLLVTVNVFFVQNTLTAQRQVFERVYGGSLHEDGKDIQQTPDGGYIIAATSDSLSMGAESDIYLIKIDEAGNILWDTWIGGSDYESPHSIQMAFDGGYIIGGSFYSTGGSSQGYLVKTDATGTLEWDLKWGGPGTDMGYTACPTMDGGYVLCGFTYPAGSPTNDAFLIKADALGNLVWGKTYGGSANDAAYCTQQTADGGFIIAGQTSSYGAGQGDVFLIKTDSNGIPAWEKTYGSADSEIGVSVQQDAEQGYIVAGYGGPLGLNNDDIYAVRTDPSGNIMWEMRYGGSDDEFGSCVQQWSAGGFVIAGTTYSYGSGAGDYYLVRIDHLGNMLWSRTYGSSEMEVMGTIRETDDGGLLMVGMVSQPSSMYGNIYLVKADVWGPEPWKAEAFDNVIITPGIDDDDEVLISFDEPTNTPLIDATNIDNVLSLDNGHSWLDVSGQIGGAIWGPGGTDLSVMLSTNMGHPSVNTGDVITPQGYVILDGEGNPAEDPIVITGSFGPGAGIADGETASSVPRTFLLSQNYPNPFNPITFFTLEIPEGVTNRVSLCVYDTRGKLVKNLVDEFLAPGKYSFHWNGKDENGSTVTSGVYIYRLISGSYTASRKLVLLK